MKFTLGVKNAKENDNDELEYFVVSEIKTNGEVFPLKTRAKRINLINKLKFNLLLRHFDFLDGVVVDNYSKWSSGKDVDCGFLINK